MATWHTITHLLVSKKRTDDTSARMDSCGLHMIPRI